MRDDTTATVAADDEDEDGWNDSDDDNSNNDSNSSTEEEQEQVKQYNFPTLTTQIHQTLTSLNNNATKGGCMPKLNWSSPKDATWMNCGTLKCTTVGDVYLLLKCSEFVAFDLERAWFGLEDEEGLLNDHDDAVNDAVQQEKQEEEEGAAKTTDKPAEEEDSSPPTDFNYELVLRKWCNLHPSMEFRCFIYNHELIAISQRHPTKFYKHLQPPQSSQQQQQQQPPQSSQHQQQSDDHQEEEEEEEEEVHPTAEIIQTFYETYVQKRFANGTIHRYVMDVYVDSQERTWIVDFNVWGIRTDALLFDWTELTSKIGQESVGSRSRRVVEKENGDDEEDVESIAPLLPEWRVVTKDMKDLTYDPLSSFRGPTDVMNLMGGGGAGSSGGNCDGNGGFEPSSFQNFMEQCVRPSEM